MDLKPESKEIVTLNPKLRSLAHPHVEIDVIVKEEECIDASIPMKELKFDTVGVIPNISDINIEHDIKFKLDVTDVTNLLKVNNKCPGEQEGIRLSKTRLKQAEKNVHKGETCEYFLGKGNLSDHVKTHTGEKRYECDICTKCFNTKQRWSHHVQAHTNDRRHKCEICERSFVQKTTLSRHTKTHIGEKNYRCDICSKSFTRKGNLSDHLKMHSGDRNYECEICTKRFVRKETLSNHAKVHTSERNYECDVCARRFRTNQNLSQHMQVHSAVRKYECEICAKRYTTKQNVLRHMDRHASERNYKCDVCAKRFTTEENLTRHVRVHTKKRNYCDVCNQYFRKRKLLLEHRKMHFEEICKEEALCELPYNVQSVCKMETQLIGEGTFVKEEKVEVDDDTHETLDTIERQWSVGAIERHIIDEKLKSTEILNVWQLLNNEIVIKEDEHMSSTSLTDKPDLVDVKLEILNT